MTASRASERADREGRVRFPGQQRTVRTELSDQLFQQWYRREVSTEEVRRQAFPHVSYQVLWMTLHNLARERGLPSVKGARRPRPEAVVAAIRERRLQKVELWIQEREQNPLRHKGLYEQAQAAMLNSSRL